MDKQAEVLKYLRTVDEATLDDIYKNVPFGYYCNENKHLGALMSRMVKVGRVVRVKPGVFRCVNFNDFKTDQKNLFS